MKKIKFTCPNCESTLRVPMHLAGVSGPCPKCGNTITAPSELDEAIDISSTSRSTVASREVHSPRISRQIHANSPPSNSPPSNGNGVATLPPPVAASAPPQQVNIARDVLSPDPMAEEEIRKAAAARYQAPLPDVAVAPLQYEEPPPPIFPSQPEEIPESSLSDYSNGTSQVGDSDGVPASEMPPVLEPDASTEEPAVTEAVQRPMVVPKTQPIRVKKNSTALPPRRNQMENRESGELPRLDVSLANGGDSSAASALIHDGTDPNRGRTRIQLPQLGEESDATRPEDFAHPAAAPEVEDVPLPESDMPPPLEEVPSPPVQLPEPPLALAPEPPAQPTPPPVPEDFAPPPSFEDIPPIEEIVGELPPVPEEAPLSYEEPAPPVSADIEKPSPRITESIPLTPLPMTALAEAEPELAAVEEVPAQVTDSAPPSDTAPPLEQPTPPVQEAPSIPMETVAAPVGEAEASAPVYHSLRNQEELPAPQMEQPVQQDPRLDDEYEEEGTAGGTIGNLIHSGVPQESSTAGQFPQEQAEPRVALEAAPIPPQENPAQFQAPASAPAASTPQRPADDWESLLGEGDEDSKPGRTAIVMLSVIGAVAIVTIVVVYFVGQALGGFTPDRDAMAGVKKPEQKPPSKPKVVTPGNTEIAADDGTNPVVPDKIEIPGKEEETAGPVTLPFDYEGSLRLQDPDAAAKKAPAPAPAKVPAVGNGGNPVASSLDGQTNPAPDQFQEKVQNILNGGATEVGSSPAPVPGPSISFPDSPRPEPAAAAPAPAPKPAAPDSFLAPSGDESRIARTREVIEAFLDAPTWKDRMKYVYQGESIRPALEEYYKKWPDTKAERYSLQFEQIEEASEGGAPYWMYFMSTSDNEEGIPIIVRVEDGNLKVDWEIYSEFQDRHFAKFLDGGIASPHTFRVVCERKSDYYGSDRDGFTDLGDYLVYEVFPPYGDIGEFSASAFVKKGSEVAKKLESNLGLGDDALAVIATLDWVSFPHGIKHLVIKDYLTEGWFK